MNIGDWFVMRPQKAQASGRSEADGILIQKGSTATRDGSPRFKRDREERDRLLRHGVLEPDLYRSVRNHLIASASAAGGIVEDGNSSGPQSWCRPSDGRSLKEALD